MKIYSKSNKKIISMLLTLSMVVTLGPMNVSASTVKKSNIGIGKNVSFYGKDNSQVAKNTTINKTKSKIDANLLKLTNKQSLGQGQTKENLKTQMKSSEQLISKGDILKTDNIIAPSDLVFAYIKTKSSEDIKRIEPYIFKIVDLDAKNKVLAAWIEVEKLQNLELLDEVLMITTVTKPKINITSEGDNLHRANMVRTLGNGSVGAGVKVGVISNGVNHIADSIALGELPSQTHVLSNTVGGDEGTAMLEILYDLAPGADLYFHDCSSNTIGFNNAVDDLVAAGCKIIVDDVGWFTEPYFEDGIVSTHIKNVVNTYGINYISSAGNSAKSHYQGKYYNDGSNYQDFSAGTSSSKNIYLSVQSGETVQAFLQWDDSMGHSANDYDLYMYNASTGAKLDFSDNTQAGNSDPIEVVGYTNYTSSPVDVAVLVNNYLGNAQTKTLELYMWANCYNNNIVKSDSIFGQSAVPEVIAVGAIDVPKPSEIAIYSSQGPVTTRSGEVRQKPDVCGAAGVSVSGVGGFPSTFYGTSAAAPHIAAIAALLWSKYPTKTGREIRDLIQNNSMDLGASGTDNVFGYGRADAYNAFIAGGPIQNIPVTEVNLDKTNLSLNIGQSTSLIATVSPVNATNKNVTWLSSDTSVITVDNAGKVTALSNGNATITVTTADGNKTASCIVTVTTPAVSVISVSLNKNTSGLIIGDTDTLIATINPMSASNKNIAWSSSNTLVATVDNAGKVTALSNGSATITVTTTDGNKTANCIVTVSASVVTFPSVSYSGHVQKIGWQAYVKDGALAGTEGQALRVEGFKILLENAPAGLKVKYKTHVQNIGWQDWVYDGALGGTEGQSLRVEALQIMLEGTDTDKYSIEYQAHVQNVGWQSWVRDGQVSGTSGKSLRIEAIRIRIIERLPTISYQGHVQNIGWQAWVKNGELAGTVAQALRVEGFKIQLENAPVGLKVKYKTHVQTIGWQEWVYDGVLGGTQGQALRVEALQIMLEGTDAEKYSIEYQTHVQNEGWKPLARDGEISGSVGKSQRIEAIVINIVRK